MNASPIQLDAPRHAILGSCVTRDAWNLPGLNLAPPALFLARISLASASLPAGGDNPLAPLISPVPREAPGRRLSERALTAQLGKTVIEQLAAARPDVLFLDFIDERFDLLACGAASINESLELIESGLLDMPPLAGARRIPRLSEEAWTLWEAGLVRMRRAVEAGRLPAGRIVLHACLWADKQSGPDGLTALPDARQILPGRIVSRAAHNDLLRRMHDAFAAHFPEALIIDLPEDVRVAATDHQWGPAPFHFIPAYYETFLQRAATHGIRLRPAAPVTATTEPPCCAG